MVIRSQCRGIFHFSGTCGNFPLHTSFFLALYPQKLSPYSLNNKHICIYQQTLIILNARSNLYSGHSMVIFSPVPLILFVEIT